MANYTAQSREAGRAPLEIGSRKDRWWTEALAFGLIFGAFIVYTTYRTFENAYYQTGNLLSPFYSPHIGLNWHVTLPILGEKMISPAMYILLFPLVFRMSCYYYRKSYYRAYLLDPPGCAMPEPLVEPRMKYSGERAFPFVLMNLHRYSFYAAAIFIFILAWDTIQTFRFDNGIGMSVGSLVYIVNVVLLSAYTFGCHSWRHLIGGKVNCYSCGHIPKSRYSAWKRVSFLNQRHAQFALWSMIWVGLTDAYVMLVARGIITNVRIF